MLKRNHKPTDATLFAHVADVLTKEFASNRIHVNSNKKTIRIRSVSTNTVHELTLKRIV